MILRRANDPKFRRKPGAINPGMQTGATSRMSTRWHFAAKDLRGAIAAYAKRFDLLEVRVALGPQPGSGEEASMPAVATLRRWRKSVPPPFDFAVVAGPHVGRVKPSSAAEGELKAACAAVDALHARCFVLRTPPEVTPAALWRDRIAKIVDRVARDATHFVWEPSGVWETAEAAAQAHAWGILLAVDPAREAVPPGPVAYLRMRALGETHSFGPLALERIVRAVGERREVFVVIETDSPLNEVKHLRRIVRATRRQKKLGGGARLVRPRGNIVVRDDEQE